jgi:hypothetical protein
VRANPHNFERFIGKVHRRFVAMRLLEQTGLGILAGCVAGLPLVVIAIWRAVPPAPLVAGALTLGAVGGLLTGLFRRPTLHDAATEADRQLDTADLLSSALSVNHSDDPWAGAVVASADAWSRSAAPSSVILNRLGARAWGGVGLATALLAVLALLPTYAVSTQAADHSFDRPNQPAFASTTNPRRVTPEQNPEDLHANRNAPDDSSTRPMRSSEATSDSHRNGSGQDAAMGRGESHTDFRSQQLSNSSDATQSHESAAKGRSADGAGKTSQTAGSANSAGSQTTGADPASPTPPWKSTNWSQQAQQALHAVDSGQVPDAYRDVIRGYFRPR